MIRITCYRGISFPKGKRAEYKGKFYKSFGDLFELERFLYKMQGKLRFPHLMRELSLKQRSWLWNRLRQHHLLDYSKEHEGN